MRVGVEVSEGTSVLSRERFDNEGEEVMTSLHLKSDDKTPAELRDGVDGVRTRRSLYVHFGRFRVGIRAVYKCEVRPSEVKIWPS